MNVVRENFGLNPPPAAPIRTTLDTLTDAVRHRRVVSATLRSGRTIRDGVCDLYPACGTHIVVFHAHNAMLVEDIARCEPVPCLDDGAVEA